MFEFDVNIVNWMLFIIIINISAKFLYKYTAYNARVLKISRTPTKISACKQLQGWAYRAVGGWSICHVPVVPTLSIRTLDMLSPGDCGG